MPGDFLAGIPVTMKLHRLPTSTSKNMFGCEEKTCYGRRHTRGYGWAASMTGRFPANEEGPVPPEPLKLNDVEVTRNGARPLVTLVLSRALTEYEARVLWEFFPLASTSERSRKITLPAMRAPPRRARLARAVRKIPRRALALQWQHQRIFRRFLDAAEEWGNKSLGATWQSAKRTIYGGEQSDKKDIDGGGPSG
jgi:hypothetical protein